VKPRHHHRHKKRHFFILFLLILYLLLLYLLHVLVVVLLSLFNLLSKTSLIVDKGLEDRKFDGLKEHTGELTPKVLVTREHGHDTSVNSLSNSLLFCSFVDRGCGGLSLLNGGLGLLLLDLSLLLHLHLHLGLLLHLTLLLGHTTTLTRTVVIRTLVLRLTREHLTLDIRIHVGRETVEHVGREHLLTVHATHARREETLLAVLGFKHSMTIGLLLGKSKEEGLAVEEVVHDLLDSLGGSLSSGKVTETEALAGAIGVTHDDAALDFTKVLEEVAKILIIDSISKITDINVGLGGWLVVEVRLVLHADLTLVFLLSTVDIKLHGLKAVLLELLLVFTLSNGANKSTVLPLQILTVESLLGLDSISVILEVDETKALALTIGVLHDDGRSDLTSLVLEHGDLTVLGEHVHKVINGELLADVLEVKVGVSVVGVVGTKVLGDELLANELLTKALELILVVLAGFEGLDRVLDLIELDETVAKAGTVILGNNLAGGDSTKVREDILKLNESDVLVETLDEKVTLVALTLSRVTTRPHDTARLTLKGFAVEGFESLLSILRALEVNVSITKRVLILHITADTDGKDGTTFFERIIDIGLTDIATKVTDVKGAVGIGGRGNGGLLGRHD